MTDALSLHSHSSLASARLKIRRARDHIHSFNEHGRRFRDQNPYRVTRALERGGREHVYRVEIVAAPPRCLGAIVGDVVHNLRSALDSIVFDLSLGERPDLSEGERRSTGFPIATDARSFKPVPIRFLSADQRAVIESVQPFRTLPAKPELEELVMVRDLNNWDKHRQVLVVPAFSMGSVHRVPTPAPVEETTHPIGPIESGAELARFRFAEPQPEIDLEFVPMFDFALGDRPQPGSIELSRAADFVEREVLARFERFATPTARHGHASC
jgi:hypothetical protein